MALLAFLATLFVAAHANPGRFFLRGLDFEQQRSTFQEQHLNAAAEDPAQAPAQALAPDSSAPAPAPPNRPPRRYFEVRKPLRFPIDTQCSVLVLLEYSFGNTINSPPVKVAYNPPPCPEDWERVVLVWNATSRGRQFDRISAVWLGGVEIFRTCTAEPSKRGIVWTVRKEVTKYSPLLRRPQSLVVSLANVIDKTYTGAINVTIAAEFYVRSRLQQRGSQILPEDLRDPMPDVADRVLPVALPSFTNGGYWFQLQNNSDVGRVKLSDLPRNIYKAQLEVCVSFHGDDEFWYTNPSNDYLDANNISSASRNGPHREVVIALDGKIVGEVCPFPVIYTGGVNPLFWRPAAAIGAFNLPTYTLDITPFVGLLVDGGSHEISFSVTNAVRNWLVDANLHLWLDPGSSQTSGELISYLAPPAEINYHSNFTGLDGTLRIHAKRYLRYSGYVESTHGSLISRSSYSYDLVNEMELSGNGSVTAVNQLVNASSKFAVAIDSHTIWQVRRSSLYPLFMYTSQQEGANESVVLEARILHGLYEDEHYFDQYVQYPYWSRVNNTQDSSGTIVVQNNIVTSGTGFLNQTYNFQSRNGCYIRIVRTDNGTVQYNFISTECHRVI